MGKKVKASAAAASFSSPSHHSKADHKPSHKLAQQHAKSRRSHAQSASTDGAVHYAAFSSQLSSLSLRLQSITGDGNCLFRSVADQVDGSQLDYANYRALACKEIAARPDLYAPFIDDSGKAGKAAAAASGLSSSSSLLAAYVDVMKRDGEWGGNLELVALSRALARDVVVHQLGAPRLVIDCGAGSHRGSPPLHIAYHSEEHYSSIRRADDTAPVNTPPLPITLPASSSSSSTAPPSSAASGVERMVMERSGCSELQRVRLMLREMDGDSESAVEILRAEREAEESERQDRQRQEEQQAEEERKRASEAAAAEEEKVRKPALSAKERRQALKAERAEKKIERARERKQERIKQKAEEEKDERGQEAKSAESCVKQAERDAEGLVHDFGSLSI